MQPSHDRTWNAARWSLLLVAIGCALRPSQLVSIAGMSRSLGTMLWLVVCAPAAMLGLSRLLRRCGVRVPAVVLTCVALPGLSLLWTAPSELPRGSTVFAQLALAALIAVLIASEQFGRQFAKAFAITSLGYLAISLVYWGGAGGERLGSIKLSDVRLSNPNTFGLQMAICAIIALEHSGLGQRAHSAGDRSSLILMGVFFSAVVLSASRGALASLAAALVVYCVSGRVSPRKIAGVAGVMVLTSVVALLAGGTFEAVFDRYFDSDRILSAGDRTPIWRAAYRATRAEPHVVWRGVGVGGANRLLGKYYDAPQTADERNARDFAKAPHNAYIEWWLSYGLLGLLPGVGLLAFLLLGCRAADRRHGTGFRMSLLTLILTAAMTTTVYHAAFAIAVLALLLASALELGDRREPHVQVTDVSDAGMPTAPTEPGLAPALGRRVA